MNGNPEDISLVEYWLILKSKWKIICAAAALVMAVSAVVSLFLPNYYTAKASVMPGSQDSSISASLAASLPAGISGFAGGLLGIQSPSDVWVGMLKSQSIRDSIIDRFGLREAYGKETIEDTRKELDKAVVIESSRDDIIYISVTDKSPEKAAQMANAFIMELDRINKDFSMSSGKNTRTFVEKRLSEAQTELARLEEELTGFQKKNKALKLDDQSRAVIEGISSLKGLLTAKEVELQTLLTYATEDNPRVQIISSEIEGLKGQLLAAEKGNGRPDIFIPTEKVPDLYLAFSRIYRDAKIQEKLFELLTQQYELARIQEAKDSPTIQVLDYAKVPEKESWPKRLLIVALSTVVSGALVAFWVLFKEYVARLRMYSEEHGHA